MNGHRRVLLSSLLAAALAAPAGVSAQWPPASFENLRVLPQDMPVLDLVGMMAGFTRALGVRCTYCHIGSEDIPLAEYDFVSDERPAKLKARRMLEMMQQINGVHLAGLEDRRQPAVDVQCITCHRGQPRPRMLQDVLIEAYESGGIDSTLTVYSTLREREYGGFAFDFGEVPLADVGAALAARDAVEDAIRIHEMNTRMNPESTFAWSSLAGALFAAADTTGAIRAYEWVLRVSPGNPVALQRLRQLGGG